MELTLLSLHIEHGELAFHPQCSSVTKVSVPSVDEIETEWGTASRNGAVTNGVNLAKMISLTILVLSYYTFLTGVGMREKSYIVKFKRGEISVRPVVAARAEIQCDNLVFLNSEGRLTALFFLDMVQSWNEVSN
jgi:hypothetical protein